MSATRELPKIIAVSPAGPAWRPRAGVPPRLVPALLSLPTLLVVFAVIGMPLIYSLVLSLHRINPLTHRWVYVGLRNYLEILPQAEFVTAAGRTLYFAALTVGGSLVLGLAMALVLNVPFRGRGLLRSVVLIPWAMSPVAIGMLWRWILDGGYGPLNALLLDIGVIDRPIFFLGSGATAFHALAVVQIWNQAPLACLLLLAGLQSLPDNLHRAARIDGAGFWGRFRRITLPWLRPMTLLVLILLTINAIMALDVFWIMTRGGPGNATTVWAWLGYAYAFQMFRFGEGSAILYVLTAACLILAVVYMLILSPAVSRRNEARTSRREPLADRLVRSAAPAAGRTLRLSLQDAGRPAQHGPRFPGLRSAASRAGDILARLVVFAWSFGPVAWLIVMSVTPATDLVRSPPALIPHSLTLDHYAFVMVPQHAEGGWSSVQASRVMGSIWNSFVVAGWVTAVNVVLGGLAGYAFAASGRSRVMRASLWALMLTRMTPSLALMLPFFIVFKTLGLIDTRAGLIIAYCSLILPLSTWIMKGYFEGLPATLERAALVDGCTRLRAIRRIILPIARPGLVAAAIFCFMVSWNEFVFALILTGTPNAQTVPVTIAGFLAQLRFYEYGPMFASSVLAIIPPVALALGFQRYMVTGMLSGALKG